MKNKSIALKIVVERDEELSKLSVSAWMNINPLEFQAVCENIFKNVNYGIHLSNDVCKDTKCLVLRKHLKKFGNPNSREWWGEFWRLVKSEQKKGFSSVERGKKYHKMCEESPRHGGRRPKKNARG